MEKREYSGQAADIWAAGVLLYAMVFGKMPFEGKDSKELAKRITKGLYTCPVYKPAQDLIAKMLVVDVSKRITAAQALQHEFLHPRCKRMPR